MVWLIQRYMMKIETIPIKLDEFNTIVITVHPTDEGVSVILREVNKFGSHSTTHSLTSIEATNVEILSEIFADTRVRVLRAIIELISKVIV
jgi:hypothetical protein